MWGRWLICLGLLLSVSPKFALGPSDLWITIRTEADRGVLTVIADGETYYRRTDLELDGRRVYQVFWRGVGPCVCAVIAVAPDGRVETEVEYR